MQNETMTTEKNMTTGNTPNIGRKRKRKRITLAELRKFFGNRCDYYGITEAQIIRRHGKARICEARILIVKDMYEAGAKTWQIQEIIPRDHTTLTYFRRKEM